jgi:hypothetical protein
MNETTRKLRQEIGMKAWNSKRSRMSADTILLLIADVWYKTLPPEIKNAAYGIQYAWNSARVDGGVALTLRDMNGWQLSILIGLIVEDGAYLTVDVVKWMLNNRQTIIDLIPNNRWE